MSISQSRYYKWKTFELGAIGRAVREIINHFSLDVAEIKFTAKYDHDESTEERTLSIEDIGSICSFSGNPDGLCFGFNDEANRWNYFMIAASHDFLLFHVSSPVAETTAKMFDILQDKLGLSQVPSPPDKSNLIEQRLTELEQRFTVTNETLTCFLSYRFNERSKTYAMEITRFLELAGVQVVSGAGYEPRRVTDKVRTRLDQPLDFLVYLLSSEGESMWTRDELSVALAKGYAVILIVEAGVKVEQGLLGDWEYLEFQAGHVSDSFIGILEALRFIRREKESPASLEHNSAQQDG